MSVWKPGAFAGETVSREIASVLLSEVRHTRALRVAPHSHEAPYFSLLLAGSYAEFAEDFEVRYEPYTLVYHDALTDHWDEIAEGGCRIFFVELLAPWLDLVESMTKLAHLFELDGGAPAWLVLRVYNEFLAADAASALTVESLLFELCDHLTLSSIEAEREPPWLTLAEDVLRSRQAERIHLPTIASELGVNASHLCRTFRRFRRRTVGEFVVGLRVRHVCRRLTETGESLREIARGAGFNDQSHMTRIFKRMTGETPAAYRRRAQCLPRAGPKK
jgi:AraC family transcriptional regulator